MSVSLILGGIGLAITLTDKCIKAIEFIIAKVDDARHLGEDVPKLKARFICECARLHAFSNYFLRENEDGIKRLETLPLISQDAIFSILPELELLFSGYSAYLEKHDIEELQREYTSNITAETGPKQQAVVRGKERQRIQEKASRWEVTKWALFEKKKISRLIEQIEEWTGRLMGLLLCGVCFNAERGPIKPQDHSTLDRLHLVTGLTLRGIIEEQDQATSHTTSLIKHDVRLETGGTENPDTRIQTLVRMLEGGEETRTTVFVEFKSFTLRRRATEPPKVVTQRVENLANLLAHVNAPNAGFRTFHCVGVVLQPKHTRYVLAFELPKESFPIGKLPLSLQEAIMSQVEGRPTLDERFAMAVAVAQTVFELHSVQWLHKSIRSENVVFGQETVRPGVDRPGYHNPYIVGFEFSREQNDRSTTEQDDHIERNIYRHPDRQGAPDDRPRFTTLHDIYSLGVVLLEIGLWRLAYKFEDFSSSEPDSIMRSLQDHARDRLPHYMGEAYTNAVLKCLDGTLVTPEIAKNLILPEHKAHLLEVNMAFSQKVVEEIKRGVKGF